MKTPLRLFLTALLLSFATSGMAETYTQLTLPALNVRIQTWTSGGTYDPIFPSTQVWNGVPFTFAEDASGNQVWMGDMDVPVNVFGATRAYTIMNSAFGAYGSVNGSIEFFGSGDGYYEMDLTQGINLRDHWNGSYNNIIDGINAVPAFNPSGARLDMQIFDLPATFSDEELVTLRFNYMPQGSGGNPFLAAATVLGPDAGPGPGPSPTPGPPTWLLISAGLGLAGWRMQARWRRGR